MPTIIKGNQRKSKEIEGNPRPLLESRLGDSGIALRVLRANWMVTAGILDPSLATERVLVRSAREVRTSEEDQQQMRPKADTKRIHQ